MCGSVWISVLVALGLFKLVGCAFRHRRAWAYGCARGSCGSSAYGGCGPHEGTRGEDRDSDEREHEGTRDARGSERHRGFRSFGERTFLRYLFEKLDTTPGQEKVIKQAFEEIRDAGRATKTDWMKSREDIAAAVSGEEFDYTAVSEVWVKHDTALEALRLKIVSALQRVHEALDERQRKLLADLIASGPGFFRG